MNQKEVAIEVADLPGICSTFPERPEQEISRENMIATLQGLLRSNQEIVVVEGQEGIGKTTLLAQFARTNNQQTLSIFVSDASRYAWDPIMVAQNLNEQIQFALGNAPRTKQLDTDIQTLLNTSIADLHRKANAERQPYYFVVDGLEDIPAEEGGAVEQIFDFLPLGLGTFRFIMSGTVENLSRLRAGRVKMKPWTLPGFSFDETVKYFADISESREHLDIIYRISQKGMPGKLASIRRLCQSSNSGANQVLTNLGDHAPDLLETEWKPMGEAPDNMLLALATLCFDSRRHNLHTLSVFCEVEPEKLKEFLDQCTFIQKGSGAEKEIAYVSYFKRFAAKKLHAKRKLVMQKAIAQLTGEPDSEDAITHLPLYLNELEHYEQLLDYLSPEHIGKVIDYSESWLPLHQKAEMGIATASKLNRDGDLLRFGLQRSTARSLESCERRRSEIEAYLAIGDFKAAHAVAQAAIAKEDRLQILAIIASAKRKKGLPIEPEVKEQIKQLYSEIEKKGLGERAVEIAVDLIYCEPELAIALVQASQDSIGSQENIDFAFANLSLRALMDRAQEPNPEEACAKMRTQVKNPEIQEFVEKIALVWGSYSAAQVIALLGKWENPADRIFMMRLWAADNRSKEDAHQMVSQALDTIIQTTEFAPNAKIYRELAMPLPYIKSAETAKALVARFDGIKASVEPVGPTEEYVWLQLLLAETESKYDEGAAINRFTDIYLSTSYLKDLTTKTACAARLVSILQRTDPDRKFDAKCDLHKSAGDELEKCLLQLLTETADHYRAVEHAIQGLTGNDPERALALANALNTEPRRDSARVKILESLGARDVIRVQGAFVEKVLANIHYEVNRTQGLLALLRGIERQEKAAGHLIDNLMVWAKNNRSTSSPEDRCRILLRIHSVCATHLDKCPAKFLEYLQGELKNAWNAIEPGYDQIDIGFRIVAEMAQSALQFAKDVLKEVQETRQKMVLDGEDCTDTHIRCCRLAIRAFSGLIPKKLYGKNELEDLADVLGDIPSPRVRALAWSEVALRMYLEGAETECREIVQTQVKAAIDEISVTDTETRATTIVGAAPVLFCAHAGTAEEMIEALREQEKDEAYRQVCDFLLTKQLPWEPSDGRGNEREKLTVEEIWDICRLLGKVQADYIVYLFIEKLVDTVEIRRNRNSYTHAQRGDIATKLKGLIAKFPAARYIQHEGYRIIAEGQIAKLEKAGGGVWDALISRAQALPNHSDQAFVMGILAGAMPSTAKLAARKQQLFEDANKKIETLSSLQDRIERYETLANAALDFNPQISRKAIEAATKDALTSESPEAEKTRSGLVDMAYRIDADFAATIASGLDNDPARVAKRVEMNERLETLKLRDSMEKGKAELVRKQQYDPEQTATAAWLALKDLNSGRLTAIDNKKARSYVQAASTLPLQYAYPVLALVIENAVRNYKDTDQAGNFLKPLFKATMMSADLARRLSAKMRHMAESHRLNVAGSELDEQSLIRGGEREKALQRIRDWVKASAKEAIKICDPYFAPENLDMLQLIRTEKPEIPVEILTSWKHQKDQNVPTPWDEAYQTYWRANYSEADPGEVRIVIVGAKEGGSLPIHDRWCISGNTGIRLGSSLNSIGITKASEVTEIEENNLPGIKDTVERYLSGTAKTAKGDKLMAMSFYLG